MSHGIAVTLVDTAGARDAQDVVEREGVARGEQARGVADLVIVVVLDRSEPLTRRRSAAARRDTASRRGSSSPTSAIARLDRPQTVRTHRRALTVAVSATTGEGLDRCCGARSRAS